MEKEVRDAIGGLDKKVDTLVSEVASLKTAIIGVTGNNGLVGSVKELERKQGAMDRNFWLLAVSLAGSGVFTAGFLTFLR